jgi:hypothetical protein
MPLRKTKQGWFWGTKGPFPDKAKALQVARAAYASGYKRESETIIKFYPGKDKTVQITAQH